MSLVDPAHPLVQLVQKDRRYSLDGYLFVLEALTFAQQSLGMGEEPAGDDDPDPTAPERSENPAGGASPGKRTRSGRRRRVERHLTGQQLCEAARVYALRQYGFLARTVLGSWGISKTDDIGEIVYNMIAIGQMRKTRKDRREDFSDVYDFSEALSRDYSFAVPDAEVS